MPLSMAAMTRPPRMACNGLPRPPNRLVPPMTAAAIAYSTKVPPSREVDTGREGRRDLEDGDADRRRHQPALATPTVTKPRHGAEERGEDDEHDPAGGRREVAAGDVVDDVVVDGQRAAAAEQLQHQRQPA